MKQTQLTGVEKTHIQNLLRDFVETFSSQSKAVARLDNVSEAVVVNMLTDKWTSISDAMWINVGNQVGWKERKMKAIVETLAFQTVILYMTIAKEEGAFFSLISKGGRGKTVASDFFEAQHRNNDVFKVNCETYFTKRIFLQKLLAQIGKKNANGSLQELYDMVVYEVKRREHPLLIIDQVGKLPIPVLLFFIALYNDLAGSCGIIWLSTEDIVKIIEKGLRRKAPGFQELESRYGATHIELPDADKNEVFQLCRVNGITDAEEMHRIWNSFGGDLRIFDRQHLKSKILKNLSKYTKKAA
ncbi:MAG: AAA family ATPase [Bacteroidota bacterium]